MSSTNKPIPTRPPWIDRGRIPCLDGLRAISIVLVISSHLVRSPRNSLPRVISDLSPFGYTGVDVFFVISGFLITLLLFREWARAGTISLRGFYWRRMLRILPAYLTYLGFIYALTRARIVSVRPIDWAAALTYTMNFMLHLDQRWPVAHIWSLSVEEHFYLLWPPALVLLGLRRSKMLLLAIVILSPILRLVIWTDLRDWMEIDFATPARLDTIAVGCLLAYAVTEQGGWKWLEWLRGRATAVLLLAALVVVLSVTVFSRLVIYAIAFHLTVEAFAIAIGISAALSNPRSLVGRLLESRPLVAIGILSYSLYLWQQLFTDRDLDYWACRWPQNIGLTLVAATISHYLVEKPFLLLKERGPSDGRGSRHPSLGHPAADPEEVDEPTRSAVTQ